VENSNTQINQSLAIHYTIDYCDSKGSWFHNSWAVLLTVMLYTHVYQCVYWIRHMNVPSTLPLQHNTWVSYQLASHFFVVLHQQIKFHFKLGMFLKVSWQKVYFILLQMYCFSLFPNLPLVTKFCQITFIYLFIFLFSSIWPVFINLCECIPCGCLNIFCLFNFLKNSGS